MMETVTGTWVERAETQAIFDCIEAAGHRAWFVGGCVRDALAGRDVADIDIATDAVPARVVALTEAAGLKAIPTGIDHGTITVVSGDLAHEVTTLRRDVETDGRRAVVAFSTDLAEDAARRDFTINALYADRSGAVLDPTGQGLQDLEAGTVRFVGDPDLRIREDYLRILRYFRFLARFGAAGPEPEALAAIAANLAGIETISGERLGHEMTRLLAVPDPAPSVATMAHAGVLMRVVPGADPSGLAPLVHLEGEVGAPPDSMRRLAVLGGEVDGLRLSRADVRRLDVMREAAREDAGAGEIGYRHGADLGRDILLLRAAWLGVPVEAQSLEDLSNGAAAEFPVKAADLSDRFSGPALGAALREREARWIASGFRLGRDALLKD